MQLPYALENSNMPNLFIPITVGDAGTSQATWGLGILSSGSDTLKFYTDATGTENDWTNNGEKVVAGTIIYKADE